MKTHSRPLKSPFLSIVLLFVLLAVAACTGQGSNKQSQTVPTMPSGTGPIEPTPTVEADENKPPKDAELGDAWTSPVDGMVLVYVPAGEFMMGAREGDEQAEPDEMPMRTVSLNAFWIDRTEVTNAMFAKFLTAKGNEKWYEAESPDAKISVLGPEWVVKKGFEDHPVTEVTWFGANAYCEWVGRRLPTEAQWEKAARGTDGRIFPWGNTQPNCSLANYWTGSQSCTDGGPAPVGSYQGGASPYNVWDMAGNVWEWVADWYSDVFYKSAPGENPTGPGSGSAKVMRGGSFESGPRTLRTSDRASDEPGVGRYRLGFRCAMPPAP